MSVAYGIKALLVQAGTITAFELTDFGGGKFRIEGEKGVFKTITKISGEGLKPAILIFDKGIPERFKIEWDTEEKGRIIPPLPVVENL